MSIESDKKEALIENLPKDWRELGAQKFACGVSKIEKVVYGSKVDIDILDYMVSLAEEEKQLRKMKQLELEKRLSDLAS